MLSFVTRSCKLLCLLCYVISQHRVVAADAQPYEFSFNIVDFQHRYEKKDAEGIITGEYGFITADGIYHETGYTTNKNGDFIITKQRNRKIITLKDAQEIFKDRPKAAKKLVEAVARACGSCKLLTKQNDDRTKFNQIQSNPIARTIPVTELPLEEKMNPILKQMMKILSDAAKHAITSSKSILDKKSKIVQKENNMSKARTKNQDVKSIVRIAKKLLSENNDSNKIVVSDRAVEKMANDLYYQFNYTITSHDHQEDGYRDGRKDGSYRSQHENGVDTYVKYVSNEFGHQPNITFVPQVNVADSEHALKGYSFRWYWS